ncbi:MAG TPA: 2-oxoglutarate dehydrogenase, E2 component, dihydrolipoamide succinyltransferase [Gaiellaceae bacterium]|nr:2-oxoglutarate dehydrogenase, E2 component, dihydrolipoamide succinyltransferase [Gaiellaceae bacterium]
MATGTAVDVVMPQMGVSVSEGTVTKWLKSVGDHVDADESIVEISTDKVDTEVPSPGTGTLTEILVHEGQTVAVGTLLGRIGDAGAGPAAPPPPSGASVAEPATQAATDAATTASSEGDAAPGEDRVTAAEPESHDGHDRTFVSPVVARIAAEHGIDPASVPGSGRGGRVTKKDMLAFVERQQGATPAVPAPEIPAPAREPASAQPPPGPPQPEGGEVVEPMNAMRRGIAEHMRRSLDTAAHVTSAIEVDMSKVVAIRDRLKPEYQRSYGVNLTYLAFVARATVETLRDWPWVNAELRGESIVTHNYVNLGFAVALEGGKGLIVPVLKHAEGLNLLGMARGVADLAERARTKKLLPDDVQGGTFTITNPGSFGTFHGTPIINQPQSGILGTYAVVKRPWVIRDENGNDAIAIRPIMNLTLTYDHRLVDGAYAGGFLHDLRARLETSGEADY